MPFDIFLMHSFFHTFYHSYFSTIYTFMMLFNMVSFCTLKMQHPQASIYWNDFYLNFHHCIDACWSAFFTFHSKYLVPSYRFHHIYFFELLKWIETWRMKMKVHWVNKYRGAVTAVVYCPYIYIKKKSINLLK